MRRLHKLTYSFSNFVLSCRVYNLDFFKFEQKLQILSTMPISIQE
ncbi:Prokaryotic membrane lipoprotein lipid attachment site profile [Nostoc flagelliforme CCNUN1]|uniref:Prokaryotic membrane lipoprotein lipid attachment site profile n=1 Tax=Nostoc flagelliforme CCNUN1 TaxID=2038116 RepID=A0A2K8SMK3_9NOSO|nr:Prokaryotic membrane lipoprotein lipid attachment site profile [Nostoc flagelliforme CCNUN1]